MYKKPETLKIVLKKPNEAPEVMDIKNTLEAKQELVGGLIELVYLDEDLILVCNEERKIRTFTTKFNI